jgi:choline dehydrogenase-like flavoprotein
VETVENSPENVDKPTAPSPTLQDAISSVAEKAARAKFDAKAADVQAILPGDWDVHVFQGPDGRYGATVSFRVGPAADAFTVLDQVVQKYRDLANDPRQRLVVP